MLTQCVACLCKLQLKSHQDLLLILKQFFLLCFAWTVFFLTSLETLTSVISICKFGEEVNFFFFNN